MRDVVSVVDGNQPGARLPDFGHVSLLSPDGDADALSVVFFAAQANVTAPA